MRGVKSGLTRRKRKIIGNAKANTMIMSPNRSKSMGKFVGPAIKSSKTEIVPIARMAMKIRKAVSFFSELNMPAKGILLLP